MILALVLMCCPANHTHIQTDLQGRAVVVCDIKEHPCPRAS
jgi:hypothetical protein